MLEETRTEPHKRQIRGQGFSSFGGLPVLSVLPLRIIAKDTIFVTNLISFIRAAKPTCSRGKFASFGE